jgi:hypothetical protein
MDKIPFAEAARLAGVHPNTVRNWRKAGKLTTALKVFENGNETWLVDPNEVQDIAQQKANNWHPNNNNSVDTPIVNPASIEPGQSNPAFEQSLALIRESVVRPLVEELAAARVRNEALALELGEMRERVKQLEADRVTREPVQEPPQAIEVQIPASVLESPTAPKQAGKRPSWWSRTFGGKG